MEAVQQKHRRPWLRFVLAGLLLCLLISGWTAYGLGIIPRLDRIESFHAPVFSTDGSSVYYLSRRAFGISWGPGLEFFTPPAKLITLRDYFHLETTDIATGRTTRIHSWRVPHTWTPRSRYRNRLFGFPYCELAWDNEILRYKIGMDAEPDAKTGYSSERRWSTGAWTPLKGVNKEKEWQTTHLTAYPWNDNTLHGRWEVVSLKGEALLLIDDAWENRSVIRQSTTAAPLPQAALAELDMSNYSNRKRLEHMQLLKATREKLLARYTSQGMAEGEALLKTGDDLEELGLYPKTPKLRAETAETRTEGIPVFAISPMEFKVGMFQDIEQAIADPGRKVRFWGNYIHHRDYDTSRKLNAFLKQDGKRFHVQTSDGLYLLAIE